MLLSRLRVVLAFGALALVQTYGCDSSPISPDGGGADATAGASQGTAGHVGSAGASGTAGAAGHVGGTAGAAGTAGASGTAGHVGGGTAGAAGTAGHGGGASCSDLQSQYGAALAAARSCTVNTSGQCTQMVSGDLSPCFSNCQTFVNDATTLNALKAQWLQAGCNQGVYACPAIACVQPTQGKCVAGDGGGGVCQPGQLGLQ